MAFYLPQFKDLIQRVLKPFNLHSSVAVRLLLGTAAQESGLGTYLRQLQGPALGVFQMEPATEKSIWKDYIKYRYDLMAKMLMCLNIDKPDTFRLETDLAYQIAMCRIKYLWAPEILPEFCAGDAFIRSLAEYWKQFYNTPKGKGTPEEFIANYNKYVGVPDGQ